MRRILSVWFFSFVGILVGCSERKTDQHVASLPSTSQQAAVKLTVLVVDDPEIADGIDLLRGEWTERSGGQLESRQWSLDEFLDAEELPGDLVVFPSRYLGMLVERKWLRPVRSSVLKDEQYDLKDVLPLVRNRMMRYGGEVFALSLGEPPLMLAIEGAAATVAAAGKSDTWGGFDNLGFRRPNSTMLRYPLAAELIARTVAYTNLQTDPAVLFDPQTMEPRLLGPSFSRAIQELANSIEAANLDGEGTTAALSWPTAFLEETSDAVFFTPLPRANEVYNQSLQQWDANTDSAASPTMLGFAGRMIGVTQCSRNATSAFKLLKWLASGETATLLSLRSDATVWFRSSQASVADRWLADANVTESASALTTDMLEADSCYVLPRVPGIDRYLQSLEEAVGKVVSGDQAEEAALQQSTESWKSITESYGIERQLAAYRRHLGLDDLGQ